MDQPTRRSVKRNLFYSLSPAAWLTFIYLVTSISWILLSDKLAYNIANGNVDLLVEFQRKKGLLFVALTAILIYFMSNIFYKRLKKSLLKYRGLEATYHVLNEATREGIFDCDLETMTAKLNKKMQFFLPGSETQISDFWETYKKRVAPADRKRLLKEFEEAIISTRTNWQTEYHLMGADNRYYTIICSIHILRNKKDNKALRLIGAIQDVTALRNLQAERYKEQINLKQLLATSIIEAQETEKNRWAEELHDNVCQLLSVAKLNLSAIDMMPGSAETFVKASKELVMEALTEIRQLSASIKPPAFDDNLLVEAIENLTQDISRVQKTTFRIDGTAFDESNLTSAHRILIYRVVQEQLTNVIKYSGATAVTITLAAADDKVCIKVADNGKGFDPKLIKNGIGLRNIHSRLQLYKGKMKINSSPGGGCELEAMFTIN